MNRPLQRDPRLRHALGGLLRAAPRAALPAQAGRLEVRASLAPAPTVQQGSGYALQARLQPVKAEPLVQLGSRHALSAKLSVSPLVCYGDTIFRDGLDL